eukprot:3933265-Rhodomonas_salina.1
MRKVHRLVRSAHSARLSQGLPRTGWEGYPPAFAHAHWQIHLQIGTDAILLRQDLRSGKGGGGRRWEEVVVEEEETGERGERKGERREHPGEWRRVRSEKIRGRREEVGRSGEEGRRGGREAEWRLRGV